LNITVITPVSHHILQNTFGTGNTNIKKQASHIVT